MLSNIKTVSGTLTIGDGELYYERIGQGTPLILCHAGFVDSRMWDTQVDGLADHYDVIRYDMRGYGRSSAASQPIARRHELLSVMQQLDIDQAILMGCSLGGTTVLDFTLDYPEKVLGLILVSATPGGFELQGEPPRYMLEMFGAMQQGDLEYASELQTRIWFDGMYREPDAVDTRLRQQVKAMNRIAVQNQTFFIADSQPLQPLDPPAVQRLGDITVRVLTIVGSLDHPEIARAATMMGEMMPYATQKTIDGGAHVVNMEQPERFNQIVTDFLANL